MKKIVFAVLILILALFFRDWNFISAAVVGSTILLGGNIAGLFIAVSPWHIFLTSNIQINILILIISIGVYLISKFIKKRVIFIATSFLLISLSIFTNPLEALKEGIENTQVPIWTTDEQRREHETAFNNSLVITLHNKIVNYSISYIDHYSKFISGDFLFLQDNMMYVIESLFILVGLFFIIKKAKGWEIILIWLFLGPIFPALYFKPPDSVTAANMLIPLTLISASGFSTLIKIGYNILYKDHARTSV